MATIRNPRSPNTTGNDPDYAGKEFSCGDPELEARRPRQVFGISITRNVRRPDPLTPEDDIRRKRRGEHLVAYRKLVASVADGGDLTTKQLDALEVAEAALSIPAGVFTRDVESYRKSVTLDDAVAQEEAMAADNRANLERLTAEIKRLRDELRRAESEHRHQQSMASIRSAIKQERVTHLGANPRLFADVNEVLDTLEIVSRHNRQPGGAERINWTPGRVGDETTRFLTTTR